MNKNQPAESGEHSWLLLARGTHCPTSFCHVQLARVLVSEHLWTGLGKSLARSGQVTRDVLCLPRPGPSGGAVGTCGDVVGLVSVSEPRMLKDDGPMERSC